MCLIDSAEMFLMNFNYDVSSSFIAISPFINPKTTRDRVEIVKSRS